jgi:hypothetical protein
MLAHAGAWQCMAMHAAKALYHYTPKQVLLYTPAGVR